MCETYIRFSKSAGSPKFVFPASAGIFFTI